MRNDIILEDTTLRDGEQAPGVAWSKDQKHRIFEALVAAGVKWIEPGIPRMGGDELRFLEEIVDRQDELMLVAWNRGIKDDIALSIDLGYRAVHIGLPTSDVHIQHSIGKSRDWVLSRAAELVRYAKDRGVFVSISAEDVGRTDEDFLVHYAGVLQEAGADRMRLSDTIGILTPERYRDKVRKVAEAVDIDPQCHCHNDFGLAVANTIAGLQGGARYFHVCVNAIGERAGMPDLAQMAMALKKLYGIDLGIRTERLAELSRTVSEATGVAMPPWTPIVGDNVCAHESGIHVKGVLADAGTFEPFRAEEVGGRHRVVIGKHSGRAGIKACLQAANIEVEDALLDRCLDKVRSAAVEGARALEPEEVARIYASVSRSAMNGSAP